MVCLKGSTREKFLSSILSWRDNFIVLNENVSNWHQKRQKTQNFPIFKDFMHFCQIFDGFCTLERWKMSTRKECVVKYAQKRAKCNFEEKLSGINIESVKISKLFRFSLFFFNFCQNIARLRGLQCWNAWGRGRLVVSVSFRFEMSSLCKKNMSQIDLDCQKIWSFCRFWCNFCTFC